jgi:hypothetical protein
MARRLLLPEDKAGSIQFQGLSARALDVARKELAKSSFSWPKVRAAYKSRSR